MDLKTAFAIAIVIALSYTALTVASIGRFSNSHAIIVQSNCTDCHAETFADLNNGSHIGTMDKNQSSVLGNYFLMRGTGDTNGLCFSCHIIRSREFGLKDPYIWGNKSAINGIVFWNDSVSYNGSETESVSVKIEAQSVSPNTSVATVDATIQLMNFSSQQSANKTFTNIIQTLSEGSNFTVYRPDVYGDYYVVHITISGTWNSTVLNVTVEGNPPILIQSSNSTETNYYSLPVDFPLKYSGMQYFHTRNPYILRRMDNVVSLFKEYNVTSIQLNEPVYDYFSNTSWYTCGASDAMCHINQRVVDMGQVHGLSEERYYSHAMSYSNNVCKNCHIN